MSDKRPFTETRGCTQHGHCTTCRAKTFGRPFRESIAKTYQVPGDAVDFDCPDGVPWDFKGAPVPIMRPQPIMPTARGVKIKQPPTPVPRDRWPAKIAKLVRHAIPTDRGVGDVLERRYARRGGRVYKKVRKLLGFPCKCDAEQATLNAMYPLS